MLLFHFLAFVLTLLAVLLCLAAAIGSYDLIGKCSKIIACLKDPQRKTRTIADFINDCKQPKYLALVLLGVLLTGVGAYFVVESFVGVLKTLLKGVGQK